MRVLGIDTASDSCAAALADGDRIAASVRSPSPRPRSEEVGAVVDACLRAAGSPMKTLGGIAVAAGPGSFTGLRVGFSAAKGWCFALGAPLAAVPTFEAWTSAAAAAGFLPDGGSVLCLMGAGRNDLYTALIRIDGGTPVAVREVALRQDAEGPAVGPERGARLIVADAAAARTIGGTREGSGGAPRIVAAADPALDVAGAVALLGARRLRSGPVADLRGSEPSYFREFSTTTRNG